MIKRILHSMVLLCFCLSSGMTQNRTANIHLLLKADVKILEFSDTLQVVKSVNLELDKLHADGYLLARVIEVTAESKKDDILQIYITEGKQFKWAHLSAGNLPQAMQVKVNFKEKWYANSVFKIGQVNNLYKKIIMQSQNNGLPFASIALDSVTIKGQTVWATLDYIPGPSITFDSLRIDDKSVIKNAWLSAYLNITPGKLFDQSIVDRIPDKIEQLDFLELQSTPQITFENEKAIVTLSLKKVPSNRIDGIVGFLPKEKSDGSTLVTGQFDMELNNLFASGKSLEAHWQSLKPRSQLLELRYLHRNLFHSPLHFLSTFYLLKEDTTFINRKGQFTFRYIPSYYALEFFTRFESSRLIGNTTDETGLRGDLSDFNITYYGLGYQLNRVNETNKRPKGVSVGTQVAVGSKSIRNPDKLPPDIRQNIDDRSTQYTIEGYINWHKPFAKAFGSLLSVKGGKLINDQLFVNDLFRVGGLKSIRGFNENFFFASDYIIGTLEMRVYFEQNSFISLFYDQAYLYYDIQGSTYEDSPAGIGAGLSFQTSRGLLNLAYALGKSSEQPFNLSLSKFHFGYVAKF